MSAALAVEHLEVRYGDLVGVADVSLEVAEGGIVALLGSNGAGKTTTLNAIAGLVPASAGHISWRGEPITNLPAFAIVPKGLALSPEGWRLFVSQTVEQNLHLGRERQTLGLVELHRDGLTLLLAEQSVPLALEIADYAYVLQTGRTVLEGKAEALENDPQVQRIYLGVKDATAGGRAPR